MVKQITANFPGTDLIENNPHSLNLLLENKHPSLQNPFIIPLIRYGTSIRPVGDRIRLLKLVV